MGLSNHRLSRSLRIASFAGLACCLIQSASAHATELSLDVDLRDTQHRIFSVDEHIPAHAGVLTLVYPKWIPGEHGPTGTIDGLTGLHVWSNGKPLPWRRHLDDMYAIDVTVPENALDIDVSFQFLSPGPGKNFGASVSATSNFVVLEWNQVVLYPAGQDARTITVRPSVRIPHGWGWASALEFDPKPDAAIRFQAASLETLVDSPFAAGKHFRRIDLEQTPPVYLNIVADREENLAITAEQIRQHRELGHQATALFGAHHYRHYDFLLVLSDAITFFGLEHHQSSDNRNAANFFTDKDSYLSGASLMTHEYVHSWNGKYRRPRGLLSADYQAPMKGDLLWVYEGMTEYWGEVLAARAGMRNPEQFRDVLAYYADSMAHTTGRSWRPLQDTADEAQVLYNTPNAWANWRRGVDYYPEGLLLWLDVDTRLRELSQSAHSLDDMVKAFYGQNDGDVTPNPYGLDDVVRALTAVQAYDWSDFFQRRLQQTSDDDLLAGLTRGGWELAYGPEPSAMFTAIEKDHKSVRLGASIGLILNAEDGVIEDVIWHSAAFDAGLAPGEKIVAVDGVKFSPDILKDAIKAAKGVSRPIEVLIQDFDQFRSVHIDYHDGLRYPYLKRRDNASDLISAIGLAK
jgi:predicted metalloprotease with PDZ domain